METRLERSFRGISTRLAVRYLEHLGGTCIEGDETSRSSSDDDAGDLEAVVTGEEWTARIAAGSVKIGPTLTLTEVTVVFEGDPDVLESLLEQFEQKAMRAGG